MRDTVETLMPDSCYILSLTRTSDGAGGWTESWGTAGTSICRLDTVAGNYHDMGGAVQTYNKLILSLPNDVVITEDNQVTHNSITYQVTSVNAGSWLAVKRAEVQKI
jgi:hypothetical protein